MIVLYDDHCSACTSFAQIVKLITKVQTIGHYSPYGAKLRKDILESDALEMFWFIYKDKAYGGRAAIWPLFKVAISIQKQKANAITANTTTKEPTKENCDIGNCSNVKHVFIRSFSLIRNSRIIQIK